jgi:multiple sugar transport system permease protein
VIGFTLFEFGPLAASLGISFFKWDLIQSPSWTGLDNYLELFTDDPLFWQSLKVTGVYSLFSVPFGLLFALLLALLLNQPLPGIAFFRTVFYLPAVVSGVAVAMLWIWVFNGEFGIANYLLGNVGIEGPNWFFSRTWVMPAFILMSLWGVGGSMIIFLAGLQGVPQELYDAAEVDGAGRLRQFQHVTWPLLTPVIFFNLIIGIIGSFQTFTNSYVITEGGPANATLFYVLYLYNNGFRFFRMGKAATMAWILFVIILALTILVLRSSRIWVFYETELQEEG